MKLYFCLVLDTCTYKAKYIPMCAESVESIKSCFNEHEKIIKVWEVKEEVEI